MINIIVNSANNNATTLSAALFQTNPQGTDFASPEERDRALEFLRAYTVDSSRINAIEIISLYTNENDFANRLAQELTRTFNLPNNSVTIRPVIRPSIRRTLV